MVASLSIFVLTDISTAFSVSSDTTLVGDQVTLNVNVFLRSLVQAIGVLIFMFVVSWQLSILAFISVPAITILSKWYGQFVRSLTKVMQTKVGDKEMKGNLGRCDESNRLTPHLLSCLFCIAARQWKQCLRGSDQFHVHCPSL